MKKWLTTYFRFLIEIEKPRLLYFLEVMEKAKSGKVPTTALLHHSLMTASALSLLLFFTKTVIPVSGNASVATEMKQQSLGQTFQLKEILPLSWYTGNIQDIPRQELGFYVTSAGSSEIMEICTEQLLTDNGQIQMLELDLFNPALGSLSEVKAVTGGMLVVAVNNSTVTGTEYMLILNSLLEYELPGSPVDTLAVTNKYTQRTHTEYVTQQGLQTSSWGEMSEDQKVFSSQLNVFQGQGKLQIPVKAQDLVSFQNAESSVDSDMKVKICLNYSFTPN